MIKQIAFLLFVCSLTAHDLYLKPVSFRLAPGVPGKVEFHNGEAFPNSQVPPVLERLRDATVISPAGREAMTGLRIEGSAGRADFKTPQANAFLLTSRTIPNFIELAPLKFHEYLKHEGLDWVIEWRQKNGEAAKPGREMYSKYVKSILHTGPADAFVTKPAGLTIEFVPLVDPASLQPGTNLTVQVLFRGTAAPGLPVEASSFHRGAVKHRQIGRTDSEGKIQIPLQVPGLWKLHTILMEKHGDSERADWESFWASLTFFIESGSADSGKRSGKP